MTSSDKPPGNQIADAIHHYSLGCSWPQKDPPEIVKFKAYHQNAAKNTEHKDSVQWSANLYKHFGKLFDRIHQRF